MRKHHLVALLFLLACAACSAQRNPCARHIERAKPYRGQLLAGEVVRAIVETSSYPWVHTTTALYATEPGPRTAEFVDFPYSGTFELEEPTMLVFRVLGSSMFHTPPDADGSYEYLTTHAAELLAIERGEDYSISLGRDCLEQLTTEGEWDTENPFAHGPGERGGWLIRFGSVEPEGLPAIEFEIGRDGECWRVR